MQFVNLHVTVQYQTERDNETAMEPITDWHVAREMKQEEEYEHCWQRTGFIRSRAIQANGQINYY